MKYTKLGGTGLTVSRLCLGTMTFGFQCEEALSRSILDKATEAGITFIDTADVYPLGGGRDATGRTEEIVGRWLKGKRESSFWRPRPWAAWDRLHGMPVHRASIYSMPSMLHCDAWVPITLTCINCIRMTPPHPSTRHWRLLIPSCARARCVISVFPTFWPTA